jgi:hypothetical protein
MQNKSDMPLRHPVAAIAPVRKPRNHTGPFMPPRLRKLVGTILIIILVLVYALVATTIASLTLGTSPWWVHMLYFLFSGLLWILPAMLIIKWMEKPAKPRE